MHHHHRERCWLGEFSAAASTLSIGLGFIPDVNQDRDQNSPTIEETGVSPTALALALTASVKSQGAREAEGLPLSPPRCDHVPPPSLFPAPQSSYFNRPLYGRLSASQTSSSSSSSISSSSSSNSLLLPPSLTAVGKSRHIHPKLKAFKLGDAPVPSEFARSEAERARAGEAVLFFSADNHRRFE